MEIALGVLQPVEHGRVIEDEIFDWHEFFVASRNRNRMQRSPQRMEDDRDESY